MTHPIVGAWRSFWHTMTSNDRHASHDSPYKQSQHMPVSQSRHAPLSSIATSAVDSQQDLSSAYNDELKRPPSISSQNVTQSPTRAPYSPGMRSMSSPTTKQPKVAEEAAAAPGEIQMSSFEDGAPPPPPVSHSWRKIEKWAERHYEELWDQLGGGSTQNDVNELEHELDITLPQDVRESITIHDGQERGGRPTGIIMGCMLLDCEEIVQEWKNWKIVNEEYLSSGRRPQPHYPIKALNQPSTSSSSQTQGSNKFWREELLERQDSQPPKAIQKAYVHPSWIPLARDWGGNCIAVDLAPGPLGKWGQVILFGRDYDCKYVIARSWSHFLAVVADDITSEKAFVDEESGELKLKEFKTETVEPPYMDILRWRADQRYGRKQPSTRRSQAPPGLKTNFNGQNGRVSPYGSPNGEDRGRSPQRFSRGPNGSPRQQIGSPLARVQEEIAQPQPIRPESAIIKDFAMENGERRSSKLVDAPTPIDTKIKNKLVDAPTPVEAKSNNKLVDVPTPVSSTAPERGEFPASRLSRVTTMSDEDKENDHQQRPVTEMKGLGVDGIDDDMKNVSI